MDPISLIGLAVSAAPTIARWLGGDSAGDVADKVASTARAVLGTDDPAKIEAKISADPAAYTAWQIRLAEIAAERDKAERTAELEALKAVLSDIASARAMQVETRSWAPAVLAAVIVCTFAGTLISILSGFAIWPKEYELTVGALLGALTAELARVYSYYFGTSAGSARKTNMLAARGQNL